MRTWADGSTAVRPVAEVESEILERVNEILADGARRIGVDLREFDVDDTGNNSSSSGFQAAFNEAIRGKANLVIPAPEAQYVLDETIVLRPDVGPQFYMDIDARAAAYNGIQWKGPDGLRVFDVKGWKRSNVYGLRIRVDPGTEDLVFMDLDGDATYGSLSQINWFGCGLTGTTAPGLIGWRLGHLDPTGGCDFSYMHFFGCHGGLNANPSVSSPGSVLYLNEGENSLQHIWVGGGCYSFDKSLSNDPTDGAHAAADTAGPTLFVYGMGNSGCNTDFHFTTRGVYLISGGRHEVGKRFLDVGAPSHTSGADVTVEGVELSGYDPDDDIIFSVAGGSGLTLDNVTVRRPGSDPDYTSEMISLFGYSQSHGQLTVRGCKFRSDDPFYTVVSGLWNVDVQGTRHLDTSLGVDDDFQRIMVQAAFTNDVLNLMQGTGSAGGAAFIGFQPASAARGSVPRFRVGYDGASDGHGVLDDPSGFRNIEMRSAGVRRASMEPWGFRISGGLKVKRTLVSATPYAVLPTDHYLAVTTGSAKTVNLPAAETAGDGYTVVVKDSTGGANSNNITVVPNGAETIDGASSKVINTAYGALHLLCDGAGWLVV